MNEKWVGIVIEMFMVGVQTQIIFYNSCSLYQDLILEMLVAAV